MGETKQPIDAMQIILWVSPLLLSIPIGIATNIFTPVVQNWLATKSLSRASSRVKSLKSELDTANFYHKNPDKLYLRSAGVAFTILYLFVLGTIASALGPLYFNLLEIFVKSKISYPVYLLFSLMAVAPYLIAAIAALNQMRLITRVDRIEEFRKKVNEKIKTIEEKKPKKPIKAGMSQEKAWTSPLTESTYIDPDS